MRVPTVDKFLFCLRLETGATILGWLGMLSSTIGLLVGAVLLGMSIFNFPALINATTTPEQRLEIMKTSQFVVIILSSLMLVYSAFALYSCIQLLRGVKNRSSRQLRPYMILVAIEFVLSLLLLLRLTWQSVIQTAGTVIIDGYVFVCIHSLWEVFRDEAMRGYNRQYLRGSVCEKV